MDTYKSVFDLWHPAQAGFRLIHNCTVQALAFDLAARIRARPMVLLDFKQAYDSVEPALLWQKLRHQFEVETRAPGLLPLLASLFEDLTSVAIVNGRPTRRLARWRGLLQGAPLSPWLFSCFVDDLTRLFTHIGESATHTPQPVLPYVYAFADDFGVSHDSDEQLQEMLDGGTQWAAENHMTLHPIKCFLLATGPGTRDMRVAGTVIPRIDDVLSGSDAWDKQPRYLGFAASAHAISWPLHIERRIKKFNNAMSALFLDAITFHPATTLSIAKSFGRSVLEYGLPALLPNAVGCSVHGTASQQQWFEFQRCYISGLDHIRAPGGGAAAESRRDVVAAAADWPCAEARTLSLSLKFIRFLYKSMNYTPARAAGADLPAALAPNATALAPITIAVRAAAALLAVRPAHLASTQWASFSRINGVDVPLDDEELVAVARAFGPLPPAHPMLWAPAERPVVLWLITALSPRGLSHLLPQLFHQADLERETKLPLLRICETLAAPPLGARITLTPPAPPPTLAPGARPPPRVTAEDIMHTIYTQFYRYPFGTWPRLSSLSQRAHARTAFLLPSCRPTSAAPERTTLGADSSLFSCAPKAAGDAILSWRIGTALRDRVCPVCNTIFTETHIERCLLPPPPAPAWFPTELAAQLLALSPQLVVDRASLSAPRTDTYTLIDSALNHQQGALAARALGHLHEHLPQIDRAAPAVMLEAAGAPDLARSNPFLAAVPTALYAVVRAPDMQALDIEHTLSTRTARMESLHTAAQCLSPEAAIPFDMCDLATSATRFLLLHPVWAPEGAAHGAVVRCWCAWWWEREVRPLMEAARAREV